MPLSPHMLTSCPALSMASLINWLFLAQILLDCFPFQFAKVLFYFGGAVLWGPVSFKHRHTSEPYSCTVAHQWDIFKILDTIQFKTWMDVWMSHIFIFLWHVWLVVWALRLFALKMLTSGNGKIQNTLRKLIRHTVLDSNTYTLKHILKLKGQISGCTHFIACIAV